MSNRPGYAIQEYHDTRKVMDQLNALIKMPIRGIKKEAMEKYLDYYETKCQKSKEMIQEAMNYIPGGVQHNLAFNYPFPLVMTKAQRVLIFTILTEINISTFCRPEVRPYWVPILRKSGKRSKSCWIRAVR